MYDSVEKLQGNNFHSGRPLVQLQCAAWPTVKCSRLEIDVYQRQIFCFTVNSTCHLLELSTFVVGVNILEAETATVANTEVPVAEWMSKIMTASRKACLLIDIHMNKDVFHRVSFEMIYRSADAETVATKQLFSLHNDGITDRIKDALEFSLDDDVTRYQVIEGVAQWLGRRSLASRTFPKPVPDLWLTVDHFVGIMSAIGQPTRPTQPSIPQGSVNE